MWKKPVSWLSSEIDVRLGFMPKVDVRLGSTPKVWEFEAFLGAKGTFWKTS